MSGAPKIEIISASAGSGKTTRLAQLLEQAVADKSARPQAILATTFTNKAAAELQQRVRTTLLAAGMLEEAQQLSAARIGTVNSVCGQLVTDFAFQLGLSPELKVLDEVSSRVALKRALTGAVTEAEARELAELKDRLVELDWQAVVGALLDQARSNRIEPQALAASADRSVEGMKALLGKPATDGAALDRALVKALSGFASAVRGGPDTTKATQGVFETVEDALRTQHAKGFLPWQTWLKLAGAAPGAKSRELVAPVLEAAAAHDRHPRLHADCERAIRLCFALAERALTRYAEHKSEWAAIDFTDQEVLALELLDRPDVQARLSEQLDLVLVDEFQDTSPLQLSIFLRLAALAKRSVWVGDQKQSIFAFRGTDPALMDAALAQLLARKKPETLQYSRRSRPALVSLASDVFVRAFAAHGMPEERVRLQHPDGKEPAGLGPVLEFHRLESKNAGDDLVAMADGVAQLLADPTLQVRDRATGAPRKARPGDIAVLAKLNAHCDQLAVALASRGIAAVVPRVGLLATVEAQVVVAGIQLLADPSDTLASATLARILEYPAEPDAFLELAVGKRREAFAEHAFARRLSAAREQAARSGPLSAFDAVVAALELPARCAAWGETPQRLANVDTLRAHAVAYVDQALEEGSACTPAGLVEALRELASAEEDAQATVTGSEEAVVLTSWHRAKGLEWPIVLLYGNPRTGSALGAQVASGAKEIDIGAPLQGRWLRYWLTPYQGAQNKAPFHQRLADTPEETEAQRRGLEQELRLLYVGWTRARDRLVLTGRKKSLAVGMNELLEEEGSPGSQPRPLLGAIGNVGADGMAQVEIAGATFSVRVREAKPEPGEPSEPVAGQYFPPRAPGDWAAAFETPSGQEGLAALKTVEVLGDRLALSGQSGPIDMQRLGEAIHTFLAADGAGKASVADRAAFARDILVRWGVAGCLQPEDLVAASDRLRQWAAQWPNAKRHRELPLQLRQTNGTILRGSADLVLETPETWLVVDHKSYPGTRADAEGRAATYGGQLRAYAKALRASQSKPVRGFIHLPVTGQMVELELAVSTTPVAIPTTL